MNRGSDEGVPIEDSRDRAIVASKSRAAARIQGMMRFTDHTLDAAKGVQHESKEYGVLTRLEAQALSYIMDDISNARARMVDLLESFHRRNPGSFE